MTGRNKIQRFGFGMLRATVRFTVVKLVLRLGGARLYPVIGTIPLVFHSDLWEREASWESDVGFGSISRVTGVAVLNPLVGALLK
jgi:hypothetical protein